MELAAIGRVQAVGRIVVEPRYLSALTGLEGFSHLWVIWLFEPAGEGALLCHPRGRPDLPVVGLFATRSPHRPNPLALTLVQLRARQGCILEVEGLDAREGTAVLDLKPFIPGSDRPESVQVPDWVGRLYRERERGEQ
ncbi:MAG: TrmO family methyltransferase [Thermaerobacter sp.]|nr:TrmO family methyltransferase [Thermaerobacter sp.]